jgi:hypothetical protein
LVLHMRRLRQAFCRGHRNPHVRKILVVCDVRFKPASSSWIYHGLPGNGKAAIGELGRAHSDQWNRVAETRVDQSPLCGLAVKF